MKVADIRVRGAARVGRCAALVLLLLSIGSEAGAQTRTLEHGWELLPDESGAHTASEVGRAPGWRPVRAGLQWNAQFDDLRDYMGVAWYRTRFDVPQAATGSHVRIRFGAVDYLAEVFVNGRSLATHEGGYTPFLVDATAAVKAGTNELLVRVVDPPMDEEENRKRFPEWLYKEIPHGKQNWYVQTGGIWQPVTLEVRPALFVDRVRVTPRVSGDFTVDVVLAGTTPVSSGPGTLLSVEVRDQGGRTVFAKSQPVKGPGTERIVGRAAEPDLWSPDRPALYTVEARITGAVADTLTDRFGFRSFEARDGKFYLNGEPFYMISALDQDFYPETIYTPPSEAYVREMMLKGKRLGLNLLRCHIKVPDPAYLRAADEVGMLVWYEIPCWNDFNHFSPKAAARGEKVFAEMVDRDWNHPSVVILSIINESWGADLKQEEQRAWLRAAFQRAKTLTAPLGRLIVDNSACCENFHVETDIDDFHRYNSIPDFAADFDKWVADFASRPKWSFSPYGDAKRTGKEPLVVSEFGNWGLPNLPKELPWWFARDFAGREVTRPGGVHQRFAEFQFKRLFKDYDALATATQWHQFASLKHEIEEIRRYDSLEGYTITEFTDINWEVNGLMDMWRNPKVYAPRLATIQQADVVLGRLPKHNYTAGERVEVETLVSHYSGRDLEGARVWWSTSSGVSGRFDVDRPIRRGTVERVGLIAFVAPEPNVPRAERLLIEVRDRDGLLVAENAYEVFVFPKATRAGETALLFSDPPNTGGALRHALAVAGYRVADAAGSGGAALLIATVLDEQVLSHARRGGRVLLLANSKDALPAGTALKAFPRAGSDLDGNWVTNFNWVRSDAAPFRDVQFRPLLGWESAATIPEYVIQGVRAEDYGDVLSGIFYGWLNNNAALAVQMRAGEGKMLATTFRFGAYGTDPYATHLLDAMIRYASGPDFAPSLEWRGPGAGGDK